jgi:hypothetical protein
MLLKMTLKDVEIGMMNKNGRVYARSCFASPDLRQQIEQHRILVYNGLDNPPKLVECLGEVTGLEVGDSVNVIMDIFNRAEELLATFKQGKLGLYSVGIGEVDPCGVVTEYKLSHFGLIKED